MPESPAVPNNHRIYSLWSFMRTRIHASSVTKGETMSNNYLHIARSRSNNFFFPTSCFGFSVPATPCAVFLDGESFEIMILINNCSSFCALIPSILAQWLPTMGWRTASRTRQQFIYDAWVWRTAHIIEMHCSTQCLNGWRKNLFQFSAYRQTKKRKTCTLIHNHQWCVARTRTRTNERHSMESQQQMQCETVAPSRRSIRYITNSLPETQVPTELSVEC